jgi:hypothetical protein
MTTIAEAKARARANRAAALTSSAAKKWGLSSSSSKTKAEQRTETRTTTTQKAPKIYTSVFNVNPDAIVKTIATQPTPTERSIPVNAGTQSTKAWDIIKKRYDTSNWLTKAYLKADYAAWGLLPSGLSRTLVKAADIETSIPEIQALTKAQQRKAEAEVALDYSQKSWYEQIPFIGDYFYPETEQQYQEAAKSIAGQQLVEEQAQQAIESGYMMPSVKTSGTNWLSWGALALAGVAILIGMKK